MRRFIWATSYVAGGIAAGCLSAYVAIKSMGVEAFEAGTPWLSRAAALAEPQNFYVRANYLLEGRLPPAPGQLTESTAETDSDGRPLTGSCVYRIVSTGPLPAWWSISVIGGPSATAPLQSTAGSDTAVRRPDGSAEILVYPTPRPGNWLKSPTRRRFTILYSALERGQAGKAPAFAIRREVCL
jgi:hypothetical protein